MSISDTSLSIEDQESHPLPADHLAESLFTCAAPLTKESDLVSGIVVLLVAGIAVIVSALS